MTHTIQSRSFISFNDVDRDLIKNKSETEDNKKLLLTILDGLNKLNNVLDRLNNAIEKEITEQNIDGKSQ